MKTFLKMLLFVAIPLMTAGPAWAGTITGKVDFTGTAPAQKPLDMNADPTCAGAHPTPVMSEDVVVNDNQTLKNVFVYVKEGLEGQVFPAPKDAVMLDQHGCQYSPHVFGVQVGQPLRIVNSDSTLHNVHGMSAKSREFNLGMPIKGMKLNRKFDQPEIMVKFKCDVHPWMHAYGGVLSHPFYSVTGEDGTFSIKNLPAGSYVIEAWHETYGTQTQSVTVDESGTATANFSYSG